MDFDYVSNDPFGGIETKTIASVFIVVCVVLCVYYFLRYNREKTETPPNMEELGRSTWTLLHTMAAKYPYEADRNLQQDTMNFLQVFAKLYPCPKCSNHMMDYMNGRKPTLSGRFQFTKWLCDFHNSVNAKLGKRIFPLEKVEERWATAKVCTKEQKCSYS